MGYFKKYCIKAALSISILFSGLYGHAQSSLNFDGTNDYIQIPNVVSTASAFTIEFWMKTTQAGGNGGQWYNGAGLVDAEMGGAANDFGISLVGSKIAFGIGNTDKTIFSASNVNTGNWVHVAAVWDGNAATMKLYINGFLEALETSNVPVAQRNASATITLGAINTLNNYYKGSIDELRIWNVALAQPQDNINCLVSTATGLAAYYSFNDGTANGSNTSITQIADSTGNGNTGTLNNFALTGSVSNFTDNVVYPATAVSIASNTTNPYNGYNIIFTATVVAAGSDCTYQWYKNDGPVTNATNATYASTTLADNDQIYCVIRSSTACSTAADYQSNTITLHYAAPIKWYVKAGATGGGTSWADAGELQTVINNANGNEILGDSIFVAAGTYTSIASYSMKEGVKIFGGFPATGNPTWADRDYINNLTILKGSNGNRVIHNNNNGLTAAAVLDGFTIRDGELSYTAYTPDWADAGAGMRNDNVSPTVRNCVFTNNKAAGNGAGVLNTGGTPLFVNCTFSANICSYEVTSNDVGGGGMANRNSTPTLINCTFSGNQNYSSPSSGNHGGGGGALYNYHSDAVVTNCTFSDNIAGSRGGAVYNRAASPVFTNCRFFSNRGYEGGALHNAQGGAFDPGYSNPVFTSCVFANNRAAIGGAVYSGATIRSNSIVVFTNCVFYGNITPDPNGGWGWGGVVYSNHATHKFINCVITNNTAATEASVIFGLAATTEIRNTVIAGNNGGVVCMNDGGVNDLYIYNSLVQSYPSYNPSNPNNTANLYADNNIDGAIDPQFVNPANPAGVDGIWGTADDGLQLQSCSPLVGAGNNTYVTGTTDVTGNPRLYGENVDIGAYELQTIPGTSSFTITTPSSQNACLGSDFPELQFTNGENGQVCFIINENSTQTITAPEGAVFTEVIFASYGNASGSCETGFTMGSCHAANTQSIVEDLALGNNSFTITASNAALGGDPCSGTLKKLYITIAYVHPEYEYEYSWINDNPSIGLPASGTGNIPAFEALEPGVANITLTASLDACTISDPVMFTYTVEDFGPLYVDGSVSVSVSGNGKSWGTAFKTLQEALATANSSPCGTDSIMVAKGTYMPASGQSFFMIEGVKILGGYPNGGGERNIAQNPTILQANGSYIIYNESNGITALALLDGFTLTGTGDAYYAMFNAYGAPSVNNCIFKGNTGGAILNTGIASPSPPIISNCIFLDNGNLYSSYLEGGAVSNVVTEVYYVNCLFLGNSAWRGGAMYNTGYGIAVVNCTFYNNTSWDSDSESHAMYNLSNSVHIVNNIFAGHSGPSIFEWSFLSPSYVNYNLIEDESYVNYNINEWFNIHATPQFVNASNPIGPDGIWGTEDDGLKLQAFSPAVNGGFNNDYNGLIGNIATDLDLSGNPRLYGTNVDMGAYELQSRYGVIWTTSNSWLNNVEPDAEKEVFIEGNLNVGTDYGDFSAYSLTVEEEGSLTIKDGNSVTVHGPIVNNAAAEAFVVKSGGNLLQTEDYELDENEGAITVERESQEIVRLDYMMWSSPVKGQGLKAFSPETIWNRIYTYETTSINAETDGAYVEVFASSAVPDTDFVNGKGYLFRAPNNWNLQHGNQPTAYPGKFVGEPFNGSISVATYPGSYTSVGNPYPSNIDPSLFLSLNPGLGTLYFWNNPERIFNESNQQWEYTGTKYVTYSIAGFVPFEYEGNSITTGQGLIVKTSGTSVNFTNEMRVGNAGSFFRNPAEKHRFWLKLSAGDNDYNQMLVSYMPGATMGVDIGIEGDQFGYNGSALYNVINEEKYTIQGRPLPFHPSDIVPLGFKAEANGKFRISLVNFDGLFTEGEVTIYLKDKYEDITHSLMQSDYEFKSRAGEYNDRFEVVYRKGKQSDPQASSLNGIRIYKNKDNDKIVVESERDKILKVEVYNLHGRILHSNKEVNTQTYKIDSDRLGKQILVVTAQAESGELVTKKVINN